MIDHWDRWFVDLAQFVSKRSKDPSTKFGAVIVRPDRSVASLGFNGFPQGCDDSPELYANREEKYARIVHCEMNAILFAAEPVRGYTLYTWPFMSCDRCAVHVIQAGIRRCVAPALPAELQDRWAVSVARTRVLFGQAGVTLEHISD